MIPYPPVYRLIFGTVEPMGLLMGGLFALLMPSTFHQAYLGRHHWTGDASLHSNVDPKSVMVASGMGSCMLIIGTLSTSVLRASEKHLSGHPALHERILRAYLGCLLFGDFLHIAATLAYAPASVRWHPFERWTILIWGNIAGTLLPNLARLAWFAGVGRHGSVRLQ